MGRILLAMHCFVVCQAQHFQDALDRALASVLLAGPVTHRPHQHHNLFRANVGNRVVGDSLTMECTLDDETLEAMNEATREAADAGFRMLDSNNDGSISVMELKTYLKQYRYNENAIDKIFSAMDQDGSGDISLEELRDSLQNYCGCGECQLRAPQILRVRKDTSDIFDLADTDEDGFISIEELRGHLKSEGYADSAVLRIFQSLESNNDSKLCRDEVEAGFLKYAMVREAIANVVKSLVEQKRWGWTPGQREEYLAKVEELV